MSRWLLLVEDDEDDRDLMLWGLRHNGLDLEVRAAADGLEAQKLLSSLPAGERPSVIVTDLKLPKINGLELLAWLRTRPELEGVPRVVITSSAAEADREDSLRLGASEYLEKPMTLDGYRGLTDSLRRVLG